MNNDRFKFRVWDNVDKKYLDCDYEYVDFAITREGILILIASDNSDCRHIYLNENRYIIEQCTVQKDKNLKLIFEGDIVVFYGMVYEIVWDNEFSDFAMKRREFHSFNTDISKCEIIGNIHENKDLLEVNKK